MNTNQVSRIDKPGQETEKRWSKTLHLVDHKRKVTVTMNPLSKHVIHNGFTGGSNLPEPQEVQQSKPKFRSKFFMNLNQLDN